MPDGTRVRRLHFNNDWVFHFSPAFLLICATKPFLRSFFGWGTAHPRFPVDGLRMELLQPMLRNMGNFLLH